MQWDDSAIQRIRNGFANGIEAGAIHLQNEIRQMISTPSRTVSVVKDKRGRDKKVLGRRGSNRSRPGEPPHKDTGRYRSSIAHTMNRETLIARVGSPMPLAKWLELGTAKMQPRPHLRRALAEQKEAIVQLAKEGAK